MVVVGLSRLYFLQIALMMTIVVAVLIVVVSRFKGLTVAWSRSGEGLCVGVRDKGDDNGG